MNVATNTALRAETVTLELTYHEAAFLQRAMVFFYRELGMGSKQPGQTKLNAFACKSTSIEAGLLLERIEALFPEEDLTEPVQEP